MTIDIAKVDIKIYPEACLKEPCHDVDPNDPDLPRVLDKMVAIMFAYNGKALAAPQVGLPWNVFVVDLGKDLEPRALVNPRLESVEGEIIETREGCLSLPGVAATMRCRNNKIVISTCLPKSLERVTLTLIDDDAVVFQHEYDHLQGLVLFDKMGKVQKMMAVKKYRKKDPKKQLERQLEYIKVSHAIKKEIARKQAQRQKESQHVESNQESMSGVGSESGGDPGSPSIPGEATTPTAD